MTFSSLGLSESILKAVTEQQYTEPYPIQIQAIPAILEGQSVLGIAQTGSGKTASFVLPILELFQRKKPARNLHLKVLILVPTRELAVQIGEVIAGFSKYLTIRRFIAFCPVNLYIKPADHLKSHNRKIK